MRRDAHTARSFPVALGAVIGALLLGGCGSGDRETMGTASPDRVIELTADPSGSLAYGETELAAAAGPITISFENPSGVVHDATIEASDGTRVGATDRVTNGSTRTTVKLEPGTYAFFCSVTGHRAAGMEGTLEVS